MSSINTNISAYYAQNNLRSANIQTQASIARLSSGNKIVSASDDVAGLSIGTILRTTVSTLRTAATNAGQGATLLQVADGALSSLGEILQRQKALAVQANSGTLSDNERSYLNQEFQALKSEYDRIVSKTDFNGVTLLDGNLAASTTSIATEVPAAAAIVAQLTDSTDTVLTTVIVGGEAGVTISTVGDNERSLLAMQGSLENAQVSGVYSGGGNLGSLTIEINGVTFQSAAFNSFSSTAAATYTFTQVLTTAEAGDTAMVISIAAADLGESADAQGITDSATAIQAELRKISLYQTRALESTAATDSSAITAAKFSGSILQGLSGADFKITGKGFDTTTGFAPSLTDFSITSNSATNATFSVKVNGVLYSTAETVGLTTGVTVDGDIAGDDINGSGVAGNGILRMTSVDDANAFVDIDLATNSLSAISVVSQDDADGLAKALNDAFGSGSAGGLSFQVGTDSNDTIAIGFSNVDTHSVYKDADGDSQTLDISTQAGAITASDVLDIAIKTITSTRADVGALQSRFGYASATLSTSIQNLDAARGQFLDTDVSAESTRFATQQVLQQAAISVLAQANQIPQNLLKLIG